MGQHASAKVIRQAMTGLGDVILDIDRGDSGLFGYVEAYANLWLLDLEGMDALDKPESPPAKIAALPGSTIDGAPTLGSPPPRVP
jgi:hypothetical protein